MSTPPTPTRIVNAALAELGSVTRITSIDDPTNIALAARTLWPDVLRELLALHPWNFALRRAPLNAAGAAPEFGYLRKFQLPADCVRWLPHAVGTPDYALCEREGDFLLSDAVAPLNIRYIAYVDTPAKWPPLFASAMTFRLAASMAEGVTQSEGIKDRLLDRAERAIGKAKRVDGLETGAQRRGRVAFSGGWLDRRNRPYGV